MLETGLKVGDRVLFQSIWFGKMNVCEGVVSHVDEPPGTVRIDYATDEVNTNIQMPRTSLRLLIPENYKGAWIETAMVKGRNFRQAYWRSREAMFNGAKRRYIGKVNSPAHQAALAIVAARKRA
jgi:hypothetical protein